MTVVNMLEAKTHFTRLVERVESGAVDEIVIARNGKPAARIVPVSKEFTAGKRLGLLQGKFAAPSQEEFDAKNVEIARLFGEAD